MQGGNVHQCKLKWISMLWLRLDTPRNMRAIAGRTKQHDSRLGRSDCRLEDGTLEFDTSMQRA